MLGKVTQSPAWKQYGHVCLACRRHQRIIAVQHRQQIRQNADLAHNISSPVADEWFNNLNDISDVYGGTIQRRNSHAIREDRPKHPAEKKLTINALEDLKASLDSLGPVALGRLQKQSTRRGRVRQRAERRTSSRASTSIQNVADLNKTSAGVPPPSAPQTSSSDQLQQIIRELQQDTGITTASRDVHNDRQIDQRARDDTPSGVEELGADYKSRPIPHFKSGPNFRKHTSAGSLPVDSITVPPGQTMRMSNYSAARNPHGEKKYRARTSPLASGLGGRITTHVSSDSNANSAKSQRSQAAFGVAQSTKGHSSGYASFTSFRDSDRRSPEKPIPTSVAATPYGISDGHGQPSQLPEHDTPPSLLKGASKSMSSLIGQLRNLVSNGTILSESSRGSHAVPQSDNPSEVREEQQIDEGSDTEPPTEQNVSAQDSAHARLTSLYHSRDGLFESRDDVPSASDNVNQSSQLPSNKLFQISPLRLNVDASAQEDRRQIHSANPTKGAVAAASDSQSAGSGSAGSGDRGSDNPSGDDAGVSIAQAMRRANTRAVRRRRGGRKFTSASQVTQSEEFREPAAEEQEHEDTQSESVVVSISPAHLHIEPLDIPQPHVPYLEYGLDRALFNPGIYQLQDPASRVYNFDPYLQNIMPVNEFDFDSLKEYKTSSKDQTLSNLAKDNEKKYIGSTSSMTSSLTHFHYLLSNWRPINLGMLSKDFVSASTKTNMTEINRAPSAIFLRWKNGTYAIDADKEFDGANVLMLLGKSMELLLTLPKSEYERYRKSDPREVPEEQKTSPEAYQYTTMRDFLMRSQLDAYDPRLPGNGTFDLKTRAVVSVRMQAKEFEPMTGYEIFSLHGKWNSYEREYYDMMRSTMLKYMLQARMGRMSGIFVAYHNVKRIFGFQYIPMHELDRALHGQTETCLGDQEFKASLDMLNEALNKATTKFPNQSLRFHFEAQEAKDGMPTALHVFAEPMADEEIDRIQNSGKAKIAAFEREIMGKESDGEADVAYRAADSDSQDLQSTAEPVDLSSASSDSDADTKFLSALESASDAELKPLFYATFIAQSRVNGEIPDSDRPTNLQKDDKWEIDYILKEYTVNAHHWALYEDMKARRKFKFAEGREDEDEGDPESDGTSRRLDGYIKMLQGLSEKSREARVRIDEMDSGKEQVLVDDGLSRDREKIEDVGDYMKWLYREKSTA